MHYPIALFGLSIILASSLCPSVGSLSNGEIDDTNYILHWNTKLPEVLREKLASEEAPTL